MLGAASGGICMTPEPIDRAQLLPEAELPEVAALIDEGRRLAASVRVGRCAFLDEYGVGSEAEYKRERAAAGTIMLHAQLGYRDPERTRRAYAEIHERLAAAGHRLDRIGLCLDQNMAYPRAARGKMPRGTGLILEGPEDYAAITGAAPAAPHFGDFVIGTPASLENAAAALAAGSTAIGNLGQYYSYSFPYFGDEVAITAETVKALALIAAQPVEVLVQSNLNDGFAALFTDLACALGMVLIERHIVEELLGASVAHCFGHNFSEPLTRLAFQRAFARVSDTPGTMVYGNTSIYLTGDAADWGSLASYFLVDVMAQRASPTGHAINPVPITEAVRIPDIDEIVDAHLMANRLIERAEGFTELFDFAAADRVADRLVDGGTRFHDSVMAGLGEAGIDTANPFELLLSLRRLGARRLEALYGPGERKAGAARRRPLVKASTITALERDGEACVRRLEAKSRAAIRKAGLKGCLASTDVHEYGKIVVGAALDGLGVGRIDAGNDVDPETLAARAEADGADFIAISTYNGLALDFVTSLRQEMERLGLEIPVFIGGRLNQVPEGSNTSLPVDVRAELDANGVLVCEGVENMLERLAEIAAEIAAGRQSAAPARRHGSRRP